MIEPGCPWYSLSQWAPPNIRWCEAQLCSWVVEPANTWSNLAFVLLGLGMAWQTHKDSKDHGISKDSLIRYFGPCSIIVGIASFLFHMSYTFVLQVVDFVGMFIFCYLILIVNAKRLGWVSAHHQFKVFSGLVLGSTALVPIFYVAHIRFQGIVLALVIAAIGSEAWVHRQTTLDPRLPRARYGFWLLAVVSMTVAAVFSALDATRVLCFPENHWFQGHAIWHLFSALALYLLFKFYRQFLKL